ncbi:MAG: transglycosylase domain-containing protein [Nocardioidaceae bacterium]
MNRPVEERLSAPRVLSHLGVMALVSAIMGLVAAGLAIPFAGALGMGAKQVATSMEKLPAELQTEDLAQLTTMVDRDGDPVATIFNQNRINIPLRQISPTMVKAILAIEDYRFYQHGALDLKGTVRALITNQANNGVVQGGSSITQQLVKQTLIAQAKTKEDRAAATDDTYARKIRELRYAIALERDHSKDWILERYLNVVYFGQGAYGVQAAAKHYFGVNAKELDLRQSAFLAGMVRNPVGYDPKDEPQKAQDRRDTVLARMAQLGAITPAEADKAMKKGLGLDVQDEPNGCLESSAQFFCDYVLAFLSRDPDFGKNPKERLRTLKSGGLTIETTLDSRFQRAAQNAVDARVDPTNSAVGGLAFVVPGTGQVRALAQSRPMGFDMKKGETFINYTIPKELGGSAGFQPGSTFKAFVLAAALEQGIPLDYAIEAPDQVAIPDSEFNNCGKPYGGSEVWDPGNATTSGLKTLYTGTRESVNTFFAQLEATTGLCQPFKIAKALGVELTDPKGDKRGNGAERVPSFTLGTPNASPLEMAEAYATFAAHGLHCDSLPVTKIVDSDGKVVKNYKAQCKQVLDAGVADGVNAVLRGVQEPGGFGYQHYLNLSIYSAGKTGTTQDQKAVWFVGYTPKLVGASMLAGANSKGEPITLQYQTVGGIYIPEASGSAFAGPIWRAAMGTIQKWLPNENFRTPDLSGIKPRGYTTVPSVTGMSVASALAVLHSAGLKGAIDVNLTGVASTSETVVKSYPTVGSSVLSGGVVLLTPSSQAPKPPRHHGHGHGGGNGGGPGQGGGFPGGGGPGRGPG